MMNFGRMMVPKDNTSFFTLMPVLNVVHDVNEDANRLISLRPNALFRHFVIMGQTFANARAVAFYSA